MLYSYESIRILVSFGYEEVKKVGEAVVYEQKKRKQNRTAFRMVGILFFGLSLFRLISMVMGNSRHMILSMVFIAGGLGFGYYLIKESVKVSAYDITYELQDDKIIIQNKKGRYTYTYDEVEDLNFVRPDETLQIDVITFKIKQTSYAVSMIGKREFAEEFFHYIEKRSMDQSM